MRGWSRSRQLASRWYFGLVFGGLLLAVAAVGPARADTAVTIGVGDTTLLVSGWTAPNAFVTLLDNASVIGTITADSDGAYSQQISAVAPGLHQLRAYSRDVAGRLSDVAGLEVHVTEHFQTSASIFLPPSFTMADSTILRGTAVKLAGSTVPQGIVTLTLDGNTTFQTTASVAGEWTYTLNTTNLDIGLHELSAMATAPNGGQQSFPAQARNLTIEPPTRTTQPELIPLFRHVAAPIIQFPSPGTTFAQRQVVVRGLAQPDSQVELWLSDRVIGSAFTDSEGGWQIAITLTDPEYVLRARTCMAQVCSSFSSEVRLFYHGLAGLAANLEQFRYTIHAGEQVELKARINGGQPPYFVNLDWGDTEERSSTAASSIGFAHTYAQTGDFSGQVTVVDQMGETAKLAFSVKVLARPAEVRWPVIAASVVPLVLLAFVAKLGGWPPPPFDRAR